MRTAQVQASMRIPTVLLEPSLIARVTRRPRETSTKELDSYGIGHAHWTIESNNYNKTSTIQSMPCSNSASEFVDLDLLSLRLTFIIIA